MPRLFISDLVQDARGRWTPSLLATLAADPQGSVSVIAPALGQDGQPLTPWCFCIVDASDYAPIAALPTVDALPVRTLATRLADLTAQQRQALRNRLIARGVAAGDIDGSVTLRDLVLAICRVKLANAGFDTSEP